MNKMQCIEQEILQNTCDIGDELKAIYYCLKLDQPYSQNVTGFTSVVHLKFPANA